MTIVESKRKSCLQKHAQSHSSCYKSVCTNTPKRMNAFSDFPMPDSAPLYPTHNQVTNTYNEVQTIRCQLSRSYHESNTINDASMADSTYQILEYLHAYSDKFHLKDYIRFNTKVTQITKVLPIALVSRLKLYHHSMNNT